uniref:magnesium chelatase subunit of protochlorophyllide reductase n=1 Tax=Cephaleuros parasiticus TaxID=173370 RepID=UPI001EE0A12A|nr:magnesium chelatase subunit of protochlorophyllide reductase [Cephaleuros parasiticus]UIB39026.1 magnesium chelatase subunit of protochlorophyllide reductase [Cephaleuros parasiticus]
MGDRGTGKSTTVRALIDLLPEISVVQNDPFNRDPLDPSFISEDSSQRGLINEIEAQKSACAPTEKENYRSGEKNVGELQGRARGQAPNSKTLSSAERGVITVKQKIPLINLPLGATEDRVCGTLDIEKALTQGVKAFEPGLLAKANRGILYVDEVNLLDDHLVDILLDSAASGWNSVEREGISVSHPANFILIGSGNPEEGELRPQLLDRFGMFSEINTVKEAELRVKIVEQRSEFDDSPNEFVKNYFDSQRQLKEKIFEARASVKNVQISYTYRLKISQICSLLEIDGIRGDIVTNRAAKALAAFNGRDNVNLDDILTVVSLCIRHRLRKDPLEAIEIDSRTKVKEIALQVFEKSRV